MAVHGKIGITPMLELAVHLIARTKTGTGEIASAGSEEIRRSPRIFPLSLYGKELLG
jgi:hypothetical protein